MPNFLRTQLALHKEKQFTGKLDLEASTGQRWSLYLNMGRLVWATGGVHTTRRWRRLIAQCYPQFNPNNINSKPVDRFECWDYHLLAVLAMRQELKQEQVMSVIEATFVEVLFDIIQLSQGSTVANQSTVPEKQVSFRAQSFGTRPSDTAILPPTWTLELEPVLLQSESIWQQWVNIGLSAYSPNLAPVIKQPEVLQKQTSPEVYKNLALLINGQRTLRDVAQMMKQDLVKVMRSLSPYFRAGVMELVQLPDLPNPTAATTNAPATATSTNQSKANSKTVVVCIDDSPQITQIMEKLLTSAGYKFIGIQNEVQALPILLQNKPDVIFLDLIMPVANGYEICSQIRRMSIFQNTPVIILTGNDGIVDRVRAKLVGATDFMSKPIDPEKVLAVVRRYQSNPESVNESR